MADRTMHFTVRVHEEPGEPLWCEVLELPACFASGDDWDELTEALTEAISLCLPGEPAVTIEDEPGKVTERRVLVTCS
ncbi:MAG TPA: hypothetical protein VMA32_13735, partial [Streptosporangiaceae bacterium]|nr:hypothetical protein [Streptosporangiaceae bacterium]